MSATKLSPASSSTSWSNWSDRRPWGGDPGGRVRTRFRSQERGKPRQGARGGARRLRTDTRPALWCVRTAARAASAQGRRVSASIGASSDRAPSLSSSSCGLSRFVVSLGSTTVDMEKTSCALRTRDSSRQLTSHWLRQPATTEGEEARRKTRQQDRRGDADFVPY